MEARQILVTKAAKQAEEVRSQLRKLESASVKKGGFKKHSRAQDIVGHLIDFPSLILTFVLQYRELLEKYIKDTDKLLSDFKTKMGGKS